MSPKPIESDESPVPPQTPQNPDDDLAAAPDHDVPNDEVIEKTLPQPNPEDQNPA